MERLLFLIFLIPSIAFADAAVVEEVGQPVASVSAWSCATATDADLVCDDFDGGTDETWTEVETAGTVDFQNNAAEANSASEAYTYVDTGGDQTTIYVAIDDFQVTSSSLATGQDTIVMGFAATNWAVIPFYLRIYNEAGSLNLKLRYNNGSWTSLGSYTLTLSTPVDLFIAYISATGSIEWWVGAASQGSAADANDTNSQYIHLGAHAGDAVVNLSYGGIKADDDTMPSF